MGDISQWRGTFEFFCVPGEELQNLGASGERFVQPCAAITEGRRFVAACREKEQASFEARPGRRAEKDDGNATAGPELAAEQTEFTHITLSDIVSVERSSPWITCWR